MTLVKSTGNKKVNLDFNKEFVNTFSEKIQSSDIQFINQTLKDLHEADVANLIENLNPDTRTKLFKIESFNIDPEINRELSFKFPATNSRQSEPILALTIFGSIIDGPPIETYLEIRILLLIAKSPNDNTP